MDKKNDTMKRDFVEKKALILTSSSLRMFLLRKLLEFATRNRFWKRYMNLASPPWVPHS